MEGVDDTNCMGKCSWHTREGEVREAPTGKNQVPAPRRKKDYRDSSAVGGGRKNSRRNSTSIRGVCTPVG